jgi:hypothetical protein
LTGDPMYGALPPVPEELRARISVPWSVLDIADGITVSPYASEEYEQQAREIVSAFAPEATSVIELSVLSERRYKPQF